jgi:hypothetical protein
MVKVIDFGPAPIHDPIYGISHSNIADRLTEENWETKAVCRAHNNQCLYILIQKGELSDSGRKHYRYFVGIELGTKEDAAFDKDFATLKEALAYVNGEDGSEFGQKTRPATFSGLPRERAAEIVVGGVHFYQTPEQDDTCPICGAIECGHVLAMWGDDNAGKLDPACLDWGALYANADLENIVSLLQISAVKSALDMTYGDKVRLSLAPSTVLLEYFERFIKIMNNVLNDDEMDPPSSPEEALYRASFYDDDDCCEATMQLVSGLVRETGVNYYEKEFETGSAMCVTHRICWWCEEPEEVSKKISEILNKIPIADFYTRSDN